MVNWLRSISFSMFFIQVMSVIDCCFLVTTQLLLAIPAGTMYYEQPQWLTTYLMAYFSPLVHMAQLATVYITVLIAVNRYLAICEPFNKKSYSLQAVKRQVSCIYCGIANTGRLTCKQIVDAIDCNTSCQCTEYCRAVEGLCLTIERVFLHYQNRRWRKLGNL